jgi:hypothetical protein
VYTNLALRLPFFDSAGKVPAGPERVASGSRPLLPLPTVAAFRPPLPDHFPFPPKPFRINTCKSVTKQTTLTFFRINTYEKHRGEGAPSSNPQPLSPNLQPLLKSPFPATVTNSFVQRDAAKPFRIKNNRTHSRYTRGVPLQSEGRAKSRKLTPLESLFQPLISNLEPLICGIIPRARGSIQTNSRARRIQ